MEGLMDRAQVGRRFVARLLLVTPLCACSPVDLNDRGTDQTSDGAGSDSGTGPFTTSQTRPFAPTNRPSVPSMLATTSPPETSDSGETVSSNPQSTPDDATSSAELTSNSAPTTSAEDATTEGPPPPIDQNCLDNQPDPLPSGRMGFAQVAGNGVEQTLGGLGGRLVFANRQTELQQYLSLPEPMVVVVCGEISLTGRLTISSNKSLLGIGPSSILRGGIDVRDFEGADVSNVIIANLILDASTVDVTIEGNTTSGIRIERAHHVWLDHLEVYDAWNGLVDVVWGSDLVTLSWNKFYFSDAAPDAERRFGVRIGDHDSDPDQSQNVGKLRVTLHHNWFSELIRQRSPRVAYDALVHLLNNYYSGESTDQNPEDHTTIWGTSNAQILLESNYFWRTTNPHDLRDDTARLVSRGNVYYETNGYRETNGTVFEPPYPYTKDSTVWLPSLVPWGAGPHLTFEPKPPWSDAGAPQPDPSHDASVPEGDASADSGLDVNDASVVDELDAAVP